MIRRFTPLDPETVFDGVALDDVTVARLMELCQAANAPPSAVIAAIVRDVLEDDASAHSHDPDEDPDFFRPSANRDLH